MMMPLPELWDVRFKPPPPKRPNPISLRARITAALLLLVPGAAAAEEPRDLKVPMHRIPFVMPCTTTVHYAQSAFAGQWTEAWKGVGNDGAEVRRWDLPTGGWIIVKSKGGWACILAANNGKPKDPPDEPS